MTTAPAVTKRLATTIALVIGTGSPWLRAVQAASWLALVAYVVFFSSAGAHAGDAHAYWAADPGDPYTTGVNEHDAYLYAPAFLHSIAPLKLLPWTVFFPVWTALNIAVLAWTVGPVLAVAVLLPGPYSPVWVNLWYGNIAILMAAALVAAFRWPAAWAFLVLTKVTPAVGLVWFIARRDWRYVGAALGVTAIICVVSFLASPDAWLEWPMRLTTTSPEIFPLPPLWLRLVAAALLAAVGGLVGARWTVPLASVLAQPVFWYTGLTMLVAWLGLVRHRRTHTADDRRAHAQAAAPST